MDKKILPSGTLLSNGTFRIDRHLGGGGFGITYLASWIQGLKFIKTGEKTVVIKELFYEDSCVRSEDSNAILVTDERKREDFDRLRKKLTKEALILNSLKPPHIVEVFDIFEENDTAYIVMEYVDGKDLEEHIKQNGHCSPDETIHYISQIASALIEVHSKSVLHLDISPSNILIDGNNNAQLIDFGVSLTYNKNTGDVNQSSKLLAGRKLGFSPPEQSSIDSLHHFSPPIDLYALGATLFNTLTGQKPPESGLLSSGSEQLALPSSYNPEVSGYLDYFVLKAMNIKVSDRFQTALEFKDALLSGEKKYAEAIEQGDRSYSSGKYQSALDSYTDAYKLINTDDDLIRKISRCRVKIEEEEEQSKKDANYTNAINAGDIEFANEKYEQALARYEEALIYKPSDSIVLSKIKDSNVKIKEKTKVIIEPESPRPKPEPPRPTPQPAPPSQPDVNENNSLRNILIGAVVVIVIGFFAWFITSKGENTEGDIATDITAIPAPAPDMSWMVQYESHVDQANEYYSNKNYESASDEYNKAIRLIPSNADNAPELKSRINAKILDCTNKINEESDRLAKSERDREEAKKLKAREDAERIRLEREDTNKRLALYDMNLKRDLGSSYYVIQNKNSRKWGIIDKKGYSKSEFIYTQSSQILKNGYIGLKGDNGWDVYNSNASKISSGNSSLDNFR